MNVVNTRTNIFCIHGFHTRTNHKKISHVVTHVLHVVTHVFYMLLLLDVKSWKYSLLQRHHQSKPQFKCQNFLRRCMHGCMRTCNKLSWGVCWASEVSYFHPPFPSLFLTFQRPINLPSYHFHKYMWVSPYYFPMYSFQYYK